MRTQASEELLALYDRAPLNRRYWTSFILLAAVYILDFFDFFLIAFILSVIGPRWHLTYGKAALILYGSGVGAIVGSLVWGSLSDVFGRKLQIVTGTLICGVSAGLIGLLPTGAFITLAALRILVGFGLAAAITPALTIIVEATPTRWRTGMTSFFVLTASAGPFLASFAAAALLRPCDARLRADRDRRSGLDLCPGIGALAAGQGALRGGAQGGRRPSRDRPRTGAGAGGPAHPGTAGEPRRTLRPAAAFLADAAIVGRLDDGGFRISAVGSDDRRSGAAHPGAAGRPILCLCLGGGDDRAHPRGIDRAADRAPVHRHRLRLCRGNRPCPGRIFPCRRDRRVPGIRDPGRRRGVFHRRRYGQSRTVYDRAIRGQARSAFFRPRPCRRRRRQDHGSAHPGPDRRLRQSDPTQGDRRRGISGLSGPRRQHAGGGLRLRVSGGRDARSRDRARCRESSGARRGKVRGAAIPMSGPARSRRSRRERHGPEPDFAVDGRKRGQYRMRPVSWRLCRPASPQRCRKPPTALSGRIRPARRKGGDDGRSNFRRPASAVRSGAAQPPLLGDLHPDVGGLRLRLLRFPGGGLSAGGGRTALASDLRPIGGDPL